MRLAFGLVALYCFVMAACVVAFVTFLCIVEPLVAPVVVAVIALAWFVGGYVKRWAES